MSTTQVTLLQKSMNNTTFDCTYCNRWAIILSLEKGLQARYCFSGDMIITRANILRDIGKIDPDIDNLNVKN